jgi:hypothetical protein
VCGLFVISYKYSSLLEKQKYIKPKGLVVYANTMLEVKPLDIRTKTLVNILQPIVEKVCMISLSVQKYWRGIYCLLELPVFLQDLINLVYYEGKGKVVPVHAMKTLRG